MKRRWLLVPVVSLILIVACCLGAVWIFQNEICDGPLALKDMTAILQDARNIPDGAPSEEINRLALLTADSKTWKNFQRWLKEAPGPYQLVLIDLEIPVTPGDDAIVGVQLSNGKNIVCSFYNRMLEGCNEVDKMPWPQERAAKYLTVVLNSARAHPTGDIPQGLEEIRLFTDKPSLSAWKSVQQWMINAPGDFQVETPPYDEYQCGYVSYNVKAHLSNGKTIACEYQGRAIRSCEEVK